MGLIKNKKGIFFTALVLVLLTLFLISFTFFSEVNERRTIQKRIETLNSFLFAIEQDIPRQLHTSGFRIIFLMEKRILEKGDYITNLNESFEEAFFQGTIEGQTNAEIQTLMADVTFSEIESSIRQKASKINANISLVDPNISISQEDPWNIKVTLVANLSVIDQSNLASWNRTATIVAFVPVIGFTDPIYAIETNNPDNVNEINQTPYSSFSSNSELIAHAQNSYYINNTDAPSFLDRLEGNLNSASQNGIESLAVPKLTSVPDVSIVDHEYFQNTPGSPTGVASYFYIDADHLSLYQVT